MLATFGVMFGMIFFTSHCIKMSNIDHVTPWVHRARLSWHVVDVIKKALTIFCGDSPQEWFQVVKKAAACTSRDEIHFERTQEATAARWSTCDFVIAQIVNVWLLHNFKSDWTQATKVASIVSGNIEASCPFQVTLGHNFFWRFFILRPPFNR